MNKSYHIDRSQKYRKSVIIWEEAGSRTYPIMYLQPPKYMKPEQWNALLDRIQIMIKPEEE